MWAVTMTRTLRRIAVVLLIVSFAMIAAHSYLLDEQPWQQSDCPFCNWLHNLTAGAQPEPVAIVVELVLPISDEPALVFYGKSHRAPFSGRAPPAS